MTLRQLLATTAIVASLSASAYAANDPAPASAMHMEPGVLASDLMGTNVYLAGDSGTSVGEISDLVVADNGAVEAVIVDVGGFLGIGEKPVAVPYSALAWNADGNGSHLLLVNATRDKIEALPPFEHVGPGMDATTPSATAAPPAAAPAGTAPDTTVVATAEPAAISADQLLNTTVYAADDANVGEIGDVILGADGKIDAVVIDVGGFLGIGEKPVAIAFSDLDITKDENGNFVLRTTFTKEQLDAAPKYDRTAFEADRAKVIVQHPG